MTIYFYTTTDEYGDFCNFAKYGILMDDRWWSTVEHYYQAMKFTDKDYQNTIRRAENPKRAKSFAYKNRNIRKDWDDIKDNIMYGAILKKFETHESIRAILIATDNEELVENAVSDYYWGCGADGTGLNKLGKILMQVRQEIRGNTYE